MNINNDAPTLTGEEEKDAVINARNQAQKIIQSAQIQAARILEEAKEKAGMKVVSQREPKKFVYNHKTGEKMKVGRSFKRQGWYDHPKKK